MEYVLPVYLPYGTQAGAGEDNITIHHLMIKRNLLVVFDNMDGSSQILIDFNNRAKKIFFLLYERFRESTKRLDRAKDENVFQQQESKYLQTLKQQLESLALEILNKSSSVGNKSQLNKKLTDEINEYIKEFRQKSRSL